MYTIYIPYEGPARTSEQSSLSRIISPEFTLDTIQSEILFTKV